MLNPFPSMLSTTPAHNSKERPSVCDLPLPPHVCLSLAFLHSAAAPEASDRGEFLFPFDAQRQSAARTVTEKLGLLGAVRQLSDAALMHRQRIPSCLT